MAEKLAALKQKGGGPVEIYELFIGARNANTGVAEGGANIYNNGTIFSLARNSTKAQLDTFLVQSDFVSSVSYATEGNYTNRYLDLKVSKAGDYLVDNSVVSKNVGDKIRTDSIIAHAIVLLP